MSFGRNPHVARAEAAELKAHEASDALARKQGWLEAARQWDRAAEREKDPKRKQVHLTRAESARAQSELDAEPNAHASEAHTRADEVESAADDAPTAAPRRWLN